MKIPYVSVVIPAYNSGATLRDTIKACLAQDYPKERMEIIVVDDGSHDNTKKITESFPVTYIFQKKKGPASARNNGWVHSRGEVICFTDSDCIPYNNWVSKLVQHFDREGVAAVAGSYAVDSSQYLLDKFVHFEIRYRHSMMPAYINSFGTYNVLIKRSVLEELKGFNPAYSRASGEDSDLSYRIIKAGYAIYFEKEALVGHSNVLRFWKYIIIQLRHGYWRMKIYRNNASMLTKDNYAYWKDFVEIFLVVPSVLCLLPVLHISRFIAGCLAGILFVIQLPLTFKISIKEKDFRYMVFSFVTLIRAFVHAAGGILGFIRFWVIRK